MGFLSFSFHLDPVQFVNLARVLQSKKETKNTESKLNLVMGHVLSWSTVEDLGNLSTDQDQFHFYTLKNTESNLI